MNGQFSSASPFVLGVSSAHGQARQFRVQVFSSTERQWRLFATFAGEQGALKCLESLQCIGYQARIVRYNLPAAA